MPRADSASGGTLPAELTSFVGRRHELDEVKRRLRGDRLVTLTGVGGSGKTRLAARAATELRRVFGDGVWFVDLTALRAPELEGQDPEVLAYLVMGALGVREQAGVTSSVERLVQYLAGRRALLVMDNCEHLLPVSAVLVDTLLKGCPRLTVLATSRERLLVGGEVEVAVSPLPVPQSAMGLAEVARCESVALFVARAQAVAPDFALGEDNLGAVAELCRRLDGLPLAIELAAARVRVLAPRQILDRLSERFGLLSRGSRSSPERQQTLRASVEWSFDLCAKPERLLWARSSVFVGGFELDAVEGICADEQLPAEKLLNMVAGLVDKSILVRDDADSAAARYRMLETLRDYGQEKLQDWGEHDAVRRRHRDWHTDLVRRAEADWLSARQPDWFARIDRELPNIRATLRGSVDDPDGADAAVAVARRLFMYWGVRGLQSEGYAWLKQALARPTASATERVKACYAAAALAILQGDRPGSSMFARDAHEVAAQLGDPRAQAIAACAEAAAALTRGEPAEAARGFQRGVDGLAAEQAEEYLYWKLAPLSALAMTKVLLGDVEGAAAAHESILRICQPRGEYWHCGFSLWVLGLGLWRQGELDGASARLREALTRLRRVNATMGTAWCVDTFAWIAFDEGQPKWAATLLGAATRLADVIGARAGLYPELAEHHEQYAQRTRDALGERAYQAAFARGERMSVDEAIAFALEEPWEPPAAEPVAASTPLTRREQQVAELITQGLANKEIAARLVISQRTAEGHVDHILTKLGFTNRAQVAAWMVAQAPPGGDRGSAG